VTGIARMARWMAGALAGLSVRDLAGALAAMLIVVFVLCWVLRDEDRSRRLTQIIGAWRGTRHSPGGESAGKASGQRGRRAAAGSGSPELPGGGAPGTG
jgi:hypothetical protein